MMSALRFEGVSHCYGKTPVLSDVSFELQSGAKVALCGPSGSGKSTLLNLAGGFLATQEGSVTVGGTELRGASNSILSQVRSQDVRCIPQLSRLVPWLSPVRNVMLQAEAAGQRLLRDEAVQLLERAGLTDPRILAAKQSKQLSPGQAQRVAVARAMVGEPRLILADEPTGALDSKNAQLVLELLLGMPEEIFQRTSGRVRPVLLVITHDETVARHFARRLVISDGIVTQARVFPRSTAMV